MSNSATAVANDGSLTTAAVPAVAPSASGSPERNGSRLGGKSFSIRSISMSSSPFPTRSPRLPSRMPARSTRSCSTQPPRRCAPSLPIGDISARRSGFRGASHLGSESQPSSPSPLRRARRRAIAGREPLDRVPSRLLPTSRCALPTVPAAVSRRSAKAFDAGELRFFSSLERLHDPVAFRRYLDPARQVNWVVYAKPPFAGAERVLEYVGRYTHRVAIANNRIVDIEDGKVCFRWKDYRNENRQR